MLQTKKKADEGIDAGHKVDEGTGNKADEGTDTGKKSADVDDGEEIKEEQVKQEASEDGASAVVCVAESCGALGDADSSTVKMEIDDDTEEAATATASAGEEQGSIECEEGAAGEGGGQVANADGEDGAVAGVQPDQDAS